MSPPRTPSNPPARSSTSVPPSRVRSNPPQSSPSPPPTAKNLAPKTQAKGVSVLKLDNGANIAGATLVKGKKDVVQVGKQQYEVKSQAGQNNTRTTSLKLIAPKPNEKVVQTVFNDTGKGKEVQKFVKEKVPGGKTIVKLGGQVINLAKKGFEKVQEYFFGAPASAAQPPKVAKPVGSGDKSKANTAGAGSGKSPPPPSRANAGGGKSPPPPSRTNTSPSLVGIIENTVRSSRAFAETHLPKPVVNVTKKIEKAVVNVARPVWRAVKGFFGQK